MKSLKPTLKKIRTAVDKKATDLPRLVGVMGDGFGNLYSDTARTMVYVRFGENTKAIPVFNNRVPAENGLQVVVGATAEQPRLQQVLSTYSNKPGGETGGIIGGYAPAQRYEWLAPSGGQDPLYIHKRAITNLNIYVTKPPSMSVQLMRGVVRAPGVMIEVPQATYDHTADIPATAGKAVLVLHTIDDAGANVQTVSSEFDVADLMPEGNRFLNMPAIPADTVFVRGLVRVYNGQAAVNEARTNNDIVDLRFSGYSGNAESVEWDGVLSKPDTYHADRTELGDGFRFGAGGALAVVTDIDDPLIVAYPVTIYRWMVYLKETGSAGTSVFDVNKNGVTVFTDQSKRPSVAYDSADGKATSGYADVVSFDKGDIISFDIDTVATGAKDLSAVSSIITPVIVTADSGQYKFGGDADQTFTYTPSISGLTFTGALSRVAGETAGTYAITQGTLDVVNEGYEIIFVSANLTVYATLTPSSASVIDTWAGSAANIIDANDSTYWESTTRRNANPWFKVDLGSSKTIARVRLLQDGSGSWNATQFRVDTSPDDSTWTTRYTSASGLTGGEYTVNLTPVACRYIRVYCTAGGAGSGWRVYDFTVKGL